MTLPAEASPLDISLDEFMLHLRPSEIERISAGLAAEGLALDDPLRLAGALRHLPIGDRAPTWELAMRRFGHRKSTRQAAGEIGLDTLHAEALLRRFLAGLALDAIGGSVAGSRDAAFGSERPRSTGPGDA